MPALPVEDPRALWSAGDRCGGGGMERFTAVVVLVLGAVVLLGTAASAVLGSWESTGGKALFLLLVVVGMWRAVGHLRSAPA